MKMTTLYAALSGALLLGAATLAPAQNVPSPAAKAVTPDKMENKAPGMSNADYKAEKDRVEADAKAAKKACNSMKDNAKDICQAEAKGKEKLAKKELDLKRNPNEKNRMDLEKMKVEVAYEVAKEKCEDQKGADALSCKKNAKAEKDRAMSAAKGKKMADSTPMSTSAGRPTTSTSPSGMNTAPSNTPSSKSGTPATSGSKTSSSNPNPSSAGSSPMSSTSAGTTGTVDSKQNKSGQ